MKNVWNQDTILVKAKEMAHDVYRITTQFPSAEKYGITSQLRRAALSVCLNMVEGYSRFKTKPHINFLEISFGSLKETQFLLEFSFDEKILSKSDFESVNLQCDEISKMLYSKIRTMQNKH